MREPCDDGVLQHASWARRNTQAQTEADYRAQPLLTCIEVVLRQNINCEKQQNTFLLAGFV